MSRLFIGDWIGWKPIVGDSGTLWGFGSTDTANNPSLSLVGLRNIVPSDAGYDSHSLAVTTDGTVWAWGNNSGGYLGIGTIGTGSSQNVLMPVQVNDATDFFQNVQAVSAGLDCTIALKNDGTVWSWGFNWVGELGNGNTTTESTTVLVVSLTGIKSISAANSFCIALTTGGNVYAWSTNTWSNLGNNRTSSQMSHSSTPVEVVGVGGAGANWQNIFLFANKRER